MREGWRKTKLDDILKIQNGYAFDSKKFNSDRGLPLIRIRSLKSGVEAETRYDGPYEEKYVVQQGDLLIGMDGEFGCYEWLGGPSLLNQRVCRLEAFSESLLPRFLFYGINNYLKIIEDATGFTTVKHLSSKRILAIEFPIPSLPEQRRIVAILDEAFEVIATTTANTEKNLQNARELFENQLAAVLNRRDEGWIKAPVAECFKVRSGDFLPTKSMNSGGEIPVYGGNGITGSHDAFNLEGEQVIIGRVGAKCGNVRYTVGNIWLTDNAFHISKYMKEFDLQFLVRLLNRRKLREWARQAAQPVISYVSIKDVELNFPSDLNQQRMIARELSDLEDQVTRLEFIWRHKLTALDELKQSLLHQAFTGVLTAKTAQQQVAETV